MLDSQLPKDGLRKSTIATLARAAIQQHRNSRLNDRLHIPYSSAELEMAMMLDQLRPRSMRSFDQIPMYAIDHIRQIKLMAPYLAGQSVAFVGDSDGASLLLGLLSTLGISRPTRMLMLDFDTRLLTMAQDLAKDYQFDNWFEVRAYNVFDALPSELVGQFDWFYSNPPYGRYNRGESTRLFVTRGCELVRDDGSGCVILPHDDKRRWTGEAMVRTQQFLSHHGWVVTNKVNNMHRYHLDDDQSLTSATMLINHVSGVGSPLMPYAARRVSADEIQHFYGRTIKLPYPHYIQNDSGLDLDWTM